MKHLYLLQWENGLKIANTFPLKSEPQFFFAILVILKKAWIEIYGCIGWVNEKLALTQLYVTQLIFALTVIFFMLHAGGFRLLHVVTVIRLLSLAYD